MVKCINNAGNMLEFVRQKNILGDFWLIVRIYKLIIFTENMIVWNVSNVWFK